MRRYKCFTKTFTLDFSFLYGTGRACLLHLIINAFPASQTGGSQLSVAFWFFFGFFSANGGECKTK